MVYGLSNSHVTHDVTWPWKVELVTPITLRAQYLQSPKLLELETSNLVMQRCIGNAERVAGVPLIFMMSMGRTNNFLWKWAWFRSRDPYNFGIRSNISLKPIELETSNLIHGFVWAMPRRRTNNFPESGRGLDHVTRYNFWQYGRLS